MFRVYRHLHTLSLIAIDVRNTEELQYYEDTSKFELICEGTRPQCEEEVEKLDYVL